MLQSLPLDASDVDPLQGSEGGQKVAVMHSCYTIVTVSGTISKMGFSPAAEWMMKSGSEISEVEYSLKKIDSFARFNFLFILPCVCVIDLVIMKTKAELPARAPRGNLL